MKSSQSSSTTTDHKEIRNWVEKRNGKPAMVAGTDHNNSALLRIDFPGYSGADSLTEISWDDWFRIFDENELAFLYQEQTEDGKESRFSKLVQRESKN